MGGREGDSKQISKRHDTSAGVSVNKAGEESGGCWHGEGGPQCERDMGKRPQEDEWGAADIGGEMPQAQRRTSAQAMRWGLN